MNTIEEPDYYIEDDEHNELKTYSYINNGFCFEYFVGYEIASLLGYKSPSKTINTIVSKSNQLSFRDYPGAKYPALDPRTILITRDGVIEILLKTRKRISPDVLHILKKFQIETTNKKCLTKEQQTLSAITNAFKTEKFEDQYKVDNYYLDLYFPDYKIIVECDENGHADRKPYDEAERVAYVNEKLEVDDTYWIRYNPDEHDFDISKVIGRIYRKIIENKIVEPEVVEIKYVDEIVLRRCNKCYEKKQLTEEFFTPVNRNGFTLTCKDCVFTTGKEKPVIQYDLDGTFIKKFTSVKNAADETKLFPSQIASTCRGDRKSAGKFVWKFESDVKGMNNIGKIKYETLKEVAQYDKTGKFIKTHKSVSYVCREYKWAPRSLYAAIQNNFISHGYIWRYVEDGVIIPKIDPVIPHKKYMKKVDIYKDGILFKSFNSIKESSVEMKVNISMVRKFLSGVKKDVNYEWKFN